MKAPVVHNKSMKAPIILLSILFFVSIGHGAIQTSAEIEFHSSVTFFQITKSKSEMQFSDALGKRTLELKKCNRKLADLFWNSLAKAKGKLQSPTPAKERLPASTSWVKFDGLQYEVGNSEPAMDLLNNVPKKTQELFAASKKACKNK